ncbi:DUF1275 domain-containing protein [Thiotrichales bacterium 19S3-7]|nr:DUF1275 domain-containing protein [Thiotrichales bacterium 19S3-7]MCF6802488.1 DUF1275 domain-containing protein [Thiotrichales bacterium 19S3-11]
MFKNQYTASLIVQFIFTAVAGWADTAGFLMVAHVFVSFMSGNSTQLMVALVQHDVVIILTMLVVLLGFVFGVVLGEVIRHKLTKRFTSVVLFIEAVALWLVAISVYFGMSKYLFLPIFSFAMGMHNTSLHKDNNLVIKTYISGTLVSLGQAIGKAFIQKENAKLIISPLIVYIGFVIGAITGAILSHAISHFISLVTLASVVSIIMLVSLFIIPTKP